MKEVNRISDCEVHKNPDMSIGERVREARKEANLTQKQLADKVGVKQPTLSELERGESFGTTSLAAMAAALGVNALWLETGRGPKRPGQGVGQSGEKYTGPERRAFPGETQYNAGPEMDLRPGRYVAIVGIGQGGPDGYISIDDHPAGRGDGEIFTYSPDPNAYAIRVRGDSMRPRIKSGEYIVAEPNIAAIPGDDVVVKLKNDKAMVKELLWQRDGEVSLGSINANVPPITLMQEEIASIHRVAAIVPRGSALVRSRFE